jgi:precorrin-6B methylase 2
MTPEPLKSMSPSPERILQTGMAFFPAKVLLSAVKLGLFTELASGPLSGAEIQRKLKLHSRGLYDFLDALVALKFLEREGMLDTATYRNTADTGIFLDRHKPWYVGGILEMGNDRLYPAWGNLAEALRTGKPQNDISDEVDGEDIFGAMYQDPVRLEQFMEAMAGVQMGNFAALVECFDFSRFKTLCDVGGASAALSVQVARRHPHMRCISADLPQVEPIARRRIEAAGVADRVQALALDFLKDPIPSVDIITMGNILHDWGHKEKMQLMHSAHAALNEGGVLIAIENVIDDERRENAFGLMMSLNMLVETPGGFDYTGADFAGWAAEAGFHRTEILPLAGPSSAAIAYK